MVTQHPSARPKVHARGNRRLDAVLDFVSFSARPMPLVSLLDEAPRRLSSIFETDVCSLYLLEGDGSELVMRGNVGFTNAALGQVRLRVGQGITGEAIEYMRPISAETAEEHEAYKHFAELGEERFPVFLAVPIRGKVGALGALVLQRKSVPFDQADVELLATLGGIIAAGIRHSELIDAQRERASERRTGGGTRKVTLTGRPAVPGRALGAIAALRRPPGHPSEHVTTPDQAKRDVRVVKSAFEVAVKAIDALRRQALELDLGSSSQFLVTYSDLLEDMRFRERTLELVESGSGPAHAFSQVARDVTRTAIAFTRDSFLEERARDIEDLCDALTMLALNDKRSVLPTKAVLFGDSLTVFDLLVSSRAHPSGIVLSDRASGPRTQTLLRLMAVPALVDVQGLFRWASDGDVVLVDADHGLLIINPSKSEVAVLREAKRAVQTKEPTD